MRMYIYYIHTQYVRLRQPHSPSGGGGAIIINDSQDSLRNHGAATACSFIGAPPLGRRLIGRRVVTGGRGGARAH